MCIRDRVHVECDFADLFDLREHVVRRRGIMQSTWDEREALLVTTYRNEKFVRALELAVELSLIHICQSIAGTTGQTICSAPTPTGWRRSDRRG